MKGFPRSLIKILLLDFEIQNGGYNMTIKSKRKA